MLTVRDEHFSKSCVSRAVSVLLRCVRVSISRDFWSRWPRLVRDLRNLAINCDLTTTDLGRCIGTTLDNVKLASSHQRLIRFGALVGRRDVELDTSPGREVLILSETPQSRNQRLLHVCAGPVRVRHGGVHPRHGDGTAVFPEYGGFGRGRRGGPSNTGRREETARRRATPAQRCETPTGRGQTAERPRDLERADQTSPVPDDNADASAEAVRRSLEEAERRLQAAEDRLADSQRQLEDARRQLQDAEKSAEELGKALTEMQIPDMDIVICLDVSFGMSEEIEGLKREITDLANLLDNLAPSTGIGVVAFGDRHWRTPIHVQGIVGLSRLAELERFVGRLVPNMNDPRSRRNQDRPEALTTALERAVGLNWRSVSRRRYIMMISDAPAYAEREQAALLAAQSFARCRGRRCRR